MGHKSGKGNGLRAVGRFFGRFFAILGTVVLSLLIIVVGICAVLLKGPSPTARDMFVTTLLETSALKFIPSLFLSQEEVDGIVSGNSVMEFEESTDSNIEFTENTVPKETIEVIDIAGPSYAGKLMIVHDPSRVKVASLNSFSNEIDGRTILRFARDNNAVAAVNGGGFADINGFGSGGLPTGIVIRDGKLMFGGAGTVSSIVAFDKDNHLIVGKMSAQEALDRGVRDALSFGPAFIINGEPAEVSGTSGGVNPRTVIGQRADGAVLLLVIDGRQPHSLGATYKDCIDVMLEHGAINAGNLDGGTSTAMVYNGEIINSCASLYGLRYIPTAFIVV